MAQWYVKDLSKLTSVSVQTLHHYDKIGLLKPSVRLPNGYRLYSEQDLLRLQQIIALKFFGFELSQIKLLLKQEVDVISHFRAQAMLLQEKAEVFQEAAKTLNAMIVDHHANKSIPWETMIQLIEVYRMTQELAKSWAGKVLSPEQLKEYANFEQGLKTRFTQDEKKTFEQNWEDLIKQIQANLDKDPSSELGKELGKRCMDLVNKLYGKKHASLRNAIWEKGYKGQQMDAEKSLPKEVVTWLDQAIASYYGGRAYNILSQIGISNPEKVQAQWETLLEDMHGDDSEKNQALVQLALNDDKVSKAAKDWLKKHYL